MRGGRVILTAGFFGLALSATGGATAATVDAAELARCAAIAAFGERLACYDALAQSVQARIAPSQQPLNPSQPPAAVTQQSAPPPPAAPSSQAAMTQPPPAAPAANSFGLRPKPVVPESPEQIKAIVDKVIEDRFGNVSIVLDSGQSWTFIEPGVLLRPGETVTIKKAALGSFLLTTRARRSYRIRRLQ